MTWFRGMERRGFRIHWIDAALPDEEKIARTLRLLSEGSPGCAPKRPGPPEGEEGQ